MLFLLINSLLPVTQWKTLNSRQNSSSPLKGIRQSSSRLNVLGLQGSRTVLLAMRSSRLVPEPTNYFYVAASNRGCIPLSVQWQLSLMPPNTQRFSWLVLRCKYGASCVSDRPDSMYKYIYAGICRQWCSDLSTTSRISKLICLRGEGYLACIIHCTLQDISKVLGRENFDRFL